MLQKMFPRFTYPKGIQSSIIVQIYEQFYFFFNWNFRFEHFKYNLHGKHGLGGKTLVVHFSVINNWHLRSSIGIACRAVFHIVLRDRSLKSSMANWTNCRPSFDLIKKVIQRRPSLGRLLARRRVGQQEILLLGYWEHCNSNPVPPQFLHSWGDHWTWVRSGGNLLGVRRNWNGIGGTELESDRNQDPVSPCSPHPDTEFHFPSNLPRGPKFTQKLLTLSDLPK